MNIKMLMDVQLTLASGRSRSPRWNFVCFISLILISACIIQARPTGHHRRHETCYDYLEIKSTPEGIDIAIPIEHTKTDPMSPSCPYVATTPLFDAPISTEAPLGMFPQRDHPLPRPGVFSGVSANTPLSTNKYEYLATFIGFP